MTDDERFMSEALQQAHIALAQGEVPVGAVVVRDQDIIGSGFNQPISANDPSAHAEVVAIRDAAHREGNYRLSGATLYVTIEPCTMCVGTLIHSRIGRVVWGANEPRAGAVLSQLQLLDQSMYNHRIEYTGGVMSSECSELIRRFFADKRRSKG